MESMLVIFVSLMVLCSTNGAAIDKKIVNDSGYFNGKFLKAPVANPHVSEGAGKVVDVSNPKSDKNDERELSDLLGKLYSTLTAKLASSKREENSVQGKKEKPVTVTVKPKKNFADLENALDKLIKTLSKEANEKDEQSDIAKKEESKDKQEFQDFTDVTNDEHKENNVESGNKSDDNKFISFDEFRKIFYHTFLRSDAEAQKLVISGRKDIDQEDKDLISVDQDDSVDKAKLEEDNKIKLDSKDKSITELYDELKEETKREKEKLDQEKMIDDLKNEVDNKVAKEEAIEAKKKELVSLLNDVTNSNNFKYEDGKIALNEIKHDDDGDFESLLANTHDITENSADKTSKKDRMEKIFLDAFKEFQEEETAKKKKENEDAKRKERLQTLLEGFVEVLKNPVKKSPSEKADKGISEEKTKKSYKSEREKSEEELLKALEGFNL